ncbi:MAG: glyoxalase/bleomycin resistance protein/dioxygenase [Gemmataceae bacterium]|nr:glyoxalase/bleomycin resistance protein/dioxygenase [Gemmataceae bacterium]
MIEQLSHTTIYVLDQDEALTFYRDKLGFEVRSNIRTDGFWWLTVSPKTQHGLELVLMPIVENPMMPADTAAKLRELVRAGTFRIGVFETSDCRGTYEELKSKGVEFQAPPTDRFYGVEAIVKDSSGNWFTLIERKKSK